jgi:predicted anti-sigma-YlaC factor YlaD
VNRLDVLLRLTARTREQELSCTDCAEILPQYVDLELGGAAADGEFPLFRQHLEQCSVCREEYEIVRDLARLDAGQPPPPDDVPPR